MLSVFFSLSLSFQVPSVRRVADTEEEAITAAILVAGGGGPYWGWYGFGPWSGYPYAYPYYAPYYSYPYPYAYPQAPYPPADTQLAVPSEPQQFYWYYCQNPQGYYPFVKSCPGGWMQVIPTPPQSEGEGAAP